MAAPVYPPRRPAQARRPRPPRGRTYGNPGGPVRNPGTGYVVNQWSATFSQPSAFGNTPPALQSAVVALTPANSAGPGTGYASQGNWLFALVGMNEQAAASGFTVGDADDIHSFWRCGDVTTSTWAVSASAALTRTSVWYTANTARQVNDVYIAPNGAMDAMSVLVIEVANLGPWDTVTGVYTNYAAAATSLNLALGAPSATSFMLAAVCGDNDSVSQALAPAGWTALHTVTATNGVDHTCDAVLTSAYLASNSGSISVNGTTGGASDLSGVIIGVQVGAPSPIPGGANPAWPGRMILEAGFGAGFETPPDQITWTTLSDSAPSWRAANHPRFWGFTDNSGVPYTLGQYQSSTGTVALDNFDSALSPGTEAGPWWPDVQTGTPVRLRCALGTAGGVAADRWYVFSRNALEWPEKRNDAWRNWVELTTTDIWSVAAASCPSPYRGEIRQDSPYAWWPMDDQLLTSGALPTGLRNAAAGNTNELAIVQSPDTTQQFYFTQAGGTTQGSAAPAAAIYAVAEQQGWMYGDPQSSPASYATSNPVTSSPGSAAWQASGQAGTVGSYGWFLHASDGNFPALSGGITVESWFSYPFYGSGTATLQQPESVMTVLELATSSAPVAVLQLDLNGHLSLITYNGSTATSNSIYTGSDLRSDSWHHVAMTLTTTTWTVYVDGGVAALVSGSATGMTSAWTDLIVNGDMGGGGASAIGTATSLIQSVSGTSSGSPLTLTLPQPTTAGNCLVVCVGTTLGSSATVSGITLGGAAGNFAAAATVASGTAVDCEIWTDANCAGGQTSVVITLSNNVSCAAQVMEWSGITSSPVDKTSTSTSGSSTYTSGATAALTQPSEIAIGAAMINLGASGQVGTAPAPWVNGTVSTGTYSLLTGYMGVPSAAAVTFSGAKVSTTAQAAAVVTLKATGLAHGGNVAVSHLAVYPSQLPAWRIKAHYWAAITGFGQLPAPSAITVQWSDSYAPDGSGKPLTMSGPAANTLPAPGPGTPFYNAGQGTLASAVVTANAGSGITSAPSAWAATGEFSGSPVNLWVQWSGLAPTFQVYTAKSIGAEIQSAVVSGSGGSFVANYGAALGNGTGQVSGLGFVQSSQNSVAGTPLTLTLPQATTAGNCLVVFVGSVGGSTNTVSGITLGGAAGNFASAETITNSSIIGCEIWTDANCAGGKTSIVISITGGGSDTVAWAVELAGVTTVSPVDKTSGHAGSAGGTTGTWTSNATSALTQASEITLGAVAMLNATTLTGPGPVPGWAELGTLTLASVTMQAGILGVSSTAAQTYNGTSSGGTSYAAAVVTLKATASDPAPPASGTALGDTVQQRIERCLGYGLVTYPNRAIDPAALLVQAARDVGGQQAGGNIQNIASSDDGLLYADNCGTLSYRDRPHLNSDPVIWNLSSAGPGYGYPFQPDQAFSTDPQRVCNSIQVTPYSPSGATPPITTPANAAAANTSQAQYGPRPLQVTSYLQSSAEQQSQANWLLSTFGTAARRVTALTVDAAGYPPAFLYFLGANVGDRVQITDLPLLGGPQTVGTYRISSISRRLFYGANGQKPEASITIVADPDVTYWS